MTRQKSLKRHVRSRMEKTGERYAAARRQVVERADRAAQPRSTRAPARPESPAELPFSEEAVRRGTGRGWDEWFAILDGWGARDRNHTETARWLVEEQGVSSWWSQSVTVGYERARGLRQKHQMRAGFEANVTRTVAVPVERLAQAITEADLRQAWLPDAPLRERPSRSAKLARFDWAGDGSVVVIHFAAKGDGKAEASVRHERLPHAEAAERTKAFWRERLDARKRELETV